MADDVFEAIEGFSGDSWIDTALQHSQIASPGEIRLSCCYRSILISKRFHGVIKEYQYDGLSADLQGSSQIRWLPFLHQAISWETKMQPSTKPISDDCWNTLAGSRMFSKRFIQGSYLSPGQRRWGVIFKQQSLGGYFTHYEAIGSRINILLPSLILLNTDRGIYGTKLNCVKMSEG